MGITKVVGEFYPDPDDEKSGLVDLEAVKPLRTPVTLAAMKADDRLKDLALIRQSRLSVMPIDETAWSIISGMGGL